MATLSGNQIKDTYASVLKLSSNGATTSVKIVEDGDGVSTALGLSTDTVRVDSLLFSTAPSTDATELTGLFLNSSNTVVKRELNEVAFTGAADSAQEVVMGVMEADLTLTGSYQTLVYANVDNANEALSYHMGLAPASFTFTNASGYVENRTEADMVVRVSISSTIDVTSQPAGVQYKLQRFNGTWNDVKEVVRDKASTGTTIDSFWGTFVLAPTEQIRIQMLVSTGGATVKAGTIVEFRKETIGDII